MAHSLVTSLKVSATGCFLLGALASMGCQSNYSGQTLPSPYYLQDDVQYFPPGPEFKLSREAAAMKTYGLKQRIKSAPLGPPTDPIPGAPAPGDMIPGGPGGVPGAPIPGAPVPGNVDPGLPGDVAPPDPAPNENAPANPGDDPFNPQGRSQKRPPLPYRVKA
jgi:hypothetical protein